MPTEKLIGLSVSLEVALSAFIFSDFVVFMGEMKISKKMQHEKTLSSTEGVLVAKYFFLP